VREGLCRRLRGASGRLGIAALAGSRIGTLTRRTRAEPLSLPKSRFERTDDVGRQGSDGQQRLRSARSTACGARPSRAKHGSASRYNRWRTSQGFVEGAPRLTRSHDPCTRAGPIRSSVQYVPLCQASGTKSAVSETSDFLGHQRARIAMNLLALAAARPAWMSSRRARYSGARYRQSQHCKQQSQKPAHGILRRTFRQNISPRETWPSVILQSEFYLLTGLLSSQHFSQSL
jgi:hypothetical protein